MIGWMDERSDVLFISTITVAEVSDGIAKLKRTGASARAAFLGEWLDLVVHLYRDRVIPFDIRAARAAGELMDRARARGHSPGFADLAIGATAVSRNLTVLTRNVRHFSALEIRTIDPFQSLPP